MKVKELMLSSPSHLLDTSNKSLDVMDSMALTKVSSVSTWLCTANAFTSPESTVAPWSWPRAICPNYCCLASCNCLTPNALLRMTANSFRTSRSTLAWCLASVPQ